MKKNKKTLYRSYVRENQ